MYTKTTLYNKFNRLRLCTYYNAVRTEHHRHTHDKILPVSNTHTHPVIIEY